MRQSDRERQGEVGGRDGWREKEREGSFRVKSPNGLNPTDSDFNEIWYTCYLGTHSAKSKI